MIETRFSVVIPTYQRRDVVVESVRALARQTFEGGFEVVVVVDGSTDGSAEALRSLRTPFPLTVLEHPNRGLAATRNRGAESAAGELLLFLDDDMEADARLLAEHDTSHRDGADVVIGHIPVHPGSPPGFLSRGVGEWAERRLERLSVLGSALPVQELLGGQLSIARERFVSLGGFDQASFTVGGTFGGEDLDFGHRVAREGLKIVFNPRAVSYQRYVVTPAHHLRQWREAGASDVALAKKHPELGAGVLAQHSPLSPLAQSVGLALRPLARLAVLALIRLGGDGPSTARWFFRVRRLEYWEGVRRAGGLRGEGVRVLCYHSFSDLRDDPILREYGVPPALLRRQLLFLKRAGFRFIDAERFLRFLDGRSGVPRLALLVTIDDCYQDVLSAALPVLESLRVPAVAFAVSERLGGSNTWDQAIGARAVPLMDADGLRSLARSGVAIGGHSRTHAALNRLPEERLDGEIAGCVADLEALGLPRPLLFAYPHGEADDAVEARAKAAGVRAAFTVEPGIVRTGTNRFALPRIEVLRSDGAWRLLWKVLRAGRRGPASRASGPPVRALELFPSQTRAGVGFNVQPNGRSAIAVRCENARPGAAIVFGGRRLQTSFGDGSLLTALVPDALIAKPGRLAVQVEDAAGMSNELPFEVR